MLKRSICAMFSSCLALVIGCGSGSNDPVVAGNGGTSPNGGTTASSTGGVAASTGGATSTPSTGGVSNSTGGTSTSSGGTPPAAGGATSQGGSATGGATTAATGGVATAGGAAPTGGKSTGGAATAGGSNATGGKAAGGVTTTTGGTASSTGGAMASTGGTSTSAGGATAAGGSTADSSGCRVWLATDGSDTAAGTQAAPVATLLHAYDLVCPPPASGSAAGTECTGASPRTICVKAGTYPMATRFEFKKTRMGTASSRVVIQADPSASAKPVFDFSTQPRVSCGANPSDGNLGGFTINADYVTLKNLEIKGANDNCVKVQGANGIVEGVVVHGCADAGIQISDGSGYTGSGTSNTVRNCDSYQNNDTQCNGENADGFAAKEASGAGNAFIGCRAWDNADDGWDLYGYTVPVRIENCWAFNQCATTLGSNSDCNGFKLGGDDVSAAHVLADLISVGNSRATGNGFTENSNPASMTCTGTCAAWGNKVNVDSINGNISTTAIGGANITNMAAASARNADGSLKSISSL